MQVQQTFFVKVLLYLDSFLEIKYFNVKKKILSSLDEIFFALLAEGVVSKSSCQD